MRNQCCNTGCDSSSPGLPLTVEFNGHIFYFVKRHFFLFVKSSSRSAHEVFLLSSCMHNITSDGAEVILIMVEKAQYIGA